MRFRRTPPPDRGELMELAARLAALDQRRLARLAECCANNRYAARARARVLHPDTPGAADLLAALDVLAATFPVPRDTPTGARAFLAAADLLIATTGRARLTTAQRLTLSLAALHALEPLQA